MKLSGHAAVRCSNLCRRYSSFRCRKLCSERLKDRHISRKKPPDVGPNECGVPVALHADVVLFEVFLNDAVSALPTAASSLSAAFFSACATSSASTAASAANTTSFAALRASAPARSLAASFSILIAPSRLFVFRCRALSSVWLRSLQRPSGQSCSCSRVRCGFRLGFFCEQVPHNSPSVMG